MSDCNKTVALLALICLAIGCGGKTTSVEPPLIENLPAPPPGMQRFEGISDERVPNEWDAYQQAWSRAMERVGQFISTQVQSEILEWNQQVAQDTLKERIVNVQSLFESTTQVKTDVTLKQVYEAHLQRQRNRDGSWKARVILLAPVDRLLAEAQQAEADLQRELTSAREDALRTVRILKAQIRETLRSSPYEGLQTLAQRKEVRRGWELPVKLARLEAVLPPYTELQSVGALIRRARQAQASRQGLEALRVYKGISILTGDDPSDDDTPIEDVSLAYQKTWEAVKAAIALLESAQKGLKSGELERSGKELDAYHERMGDATGPFTHAQTGETLRLPILPQLLREQLKAAEQILTLSLGFTNTGLTESQADRFLKGLEGKLRQKGYAITTPTDGHHFEVRGELELKKAPVGALVTLNLSVTLSLWRNKRSLVERVQFASGAQLGISEDEAFAAAQRVLLMKCAAEIDRQIKASLD